MFGINSWEQVGQIVEGHYKEFTGDVTTQEKNMYEHRMSICKECPLYSVKPGLGPVCDSKKCLNTKTNTIELLPKKDTICGCSCRLKSKCFVKEAKCVLGKW